ncbi:hypothetical protein NO263_09165 [Gluconacetobacter entanii]|uniref:Uncharacterized protein n=1 Tax=Gluconacetobacter entanii TaxID=108528 RepID=A0ABT3K5R6_9PROT|nr:hypothetical protein [Gluconacetobacter entanii]MCW4590750.1 hypothetical protein [Gluconacetobacter entanii]MCW4594219.1 hypothetical protein [Gluconacetobacter entanii]
MPPDPTPRATVPCVRRGAWRLPRRAGGGMIAGMRHAAPFP